METEINQAGPRELLPGFQKPHWKIGPLLNIFIGPGRNKPVSEKYICNQKMLEQKSLRLLKGRLEI